MRQRRERRRLRVMRTDGSQDRLVPPQAHGWSVRHVQVALPGLAQDIKNHVVQPQQDAVVSRPRQRVMKGRVFVHKRLASRDALPLADQQSFQLSNMLGRSPQRGLPSNTRLDQLAYL